MRACEAADPESFPLRGVCSECGLDFAWTDVFRPNRFRVRGFVEHSRLWLTPLTAWRTWLWTVWPGVFWSKVRLEHSPRIGRLWLWVLVVVLGPWVLAGLPAAVYYLPQWIGAWPRRSGLISVLVTPWTRWSWVPLKRAAGDPVMDFVARFPVFVGVGAVVTLVFPVVILGLPDTRAKAKVRFAHVCRAAVFQLAWLAPVMAAVAFQVLLSGVLLIISMRQSILTTPMLGGPPGARIYRGPPSPLQTPCMKLIRDVTDIAHDGWPIWVILFAIWWCLWWWFTLRRGFRLENAGLVWMTAMIPTAIAVLIVLALHPESLRLFL
jgi:hypothetical protein